MWLPFQKSGGADEAALTLAAAVMFLNEERLLPRLLASLAKQTRTPELLLLVDDGSEDGSAHLAREFAETHSYTQLLSRPQQARNADRLAGAAELIGFQWALSQSTRIGDDRQYDLVAKLDADLELPPDFFARIVDAFESDPMLGISGAPLAVASANGKRQHRVLAALACARRDQVLPPRLLGANRAATADPRLGHDRRGSSTAERLACRGDLFPQLPARPSASDRLA